MPRDWLLQRVSPWLVTVDRAVTFQPAPKTWSSWKPIDVLSSSCMARRNKWALKDWTKLGSCEYFWQWEEAKKKVGGLTTGSELVRTFLVGISLLLDNSFSHTRGRFQSFKIQKTNDFFFVRIRFHYFWTLILGLVVLSGCFAPLWGHEVDTTIHKQLVGWSGWVALIDGAETSGRSQWTRPEVVVTWRKVWNCTVSWLINYKVHL